MSNAETLDATHHPRTHLLLSTVPRHRWNPTDATAARRESMPWKPLLTVKGFRAAAGWRGWAEATRGCCGGNCDRQG